MSVLDTSGKFAALHFLDLRAEQATEISGVHRGQCVVFGEGIDLVFCLIGVGERLVLVEVWLAFDFPFGPRLWGRQVEADLEDANGRRMSQTTRGTY